MAKTTADIAAQIFTEGDMVLELRRHIEEKFANATLADYPFPHLIIEDFFPADVYSRIQEYNLFRKNFGREWLSDQYSNDTIGRTPFHTRKQINFHANDAFDAGHEEARFWGQIVSCFLADQWFESIVFEKYRIYFVLRFGELVEEPDFLSLFRKELFVQRHEPGYYIGPHSDVPTRVFTCIFSFAERNGFEEYGTQLLNHKDRLVRCWGLDHHTPDDFVVRKVAPYKPNNFLLFFKTRHSFHAVRPIDSSVPNQRYGMQFQLYEPPGGVFRDLSVPKLMSTATPHRSICLRLENAAKRATRRVARTLGLRAA